MMTEIEGGKVGGKRKRELCLLPYNCQGFIVATFGLSRRTAACCTRTAGKEGS